MEFGLTKDYGYEMRRLLLRQIKDYYCESIKRIIPDNEVDIDLLNMLCNDEDAAFDYGFIPIFEDAELTQVFYNYKTGESFTAIKTEDGYACFTETYNTLSSFSSNIALNLGLCLKIFSKEKNKILEGDLSYSLTRMSDKIAETIEMQKKLLK